MSYENNKRALCTLMRLSAPDFCKQREHSPDGKFSLNKLTAGSTSRCCKTVFLQTFRTRTKWKWIKSSCEIKNNKKRTKFSVTKNDSINKNWKGVCLLMNKSETKNVKKTNRKLKWVLCCISTKNQWKNKEQQNSKK